MCHVTNLSIVIERLCWLRGRQASSIAVHSTVCTSTLAAGTVTTVFLPIRERAFRPACAAPKQETGPEPADAVHAGEAGVALQRYWSVWYSG